MDPKRKDTLPYNFEGEKVTVEELGEEPGPRFPLPVPTNQATTLPAPPDEDAAGVSSWEEQAALKDDKIPF